MTHPDAKRAFEEMMPEPHWYSPSGPCDAAHFPYYTADQLRTAMQAAWDDATERAAKVCEEVRDLGDECKPYEDNHADGHMDGCNNCAAAIRSSGREG